MAVKKYLRRKKRRKTESRGQPFFQPDSSQHEMVEANSFFLPIEGKIQTKLKVSEPGDKDEQEADNKATKVINKKGDEDKMQRATVKDDEKPGKRSNEEKLSKKTAEEEKMQKKQDESHDRDQLEDSTIATKRKSADVAHSVPVRHKALQKNNGSALPASTLSEMSNSFGYDFSKVTIHTDKNAEAMSEQLHAQAFTYKGEVYFNRDKYNPNSEQGKWLLAHELTHVIQQSGDLPKIQRKDVPGISTPVPKDFKVIMKDEVLIAAEGVVRGIKIVIKPDQNGEVPEGKSASTGIHLSYTLPVPIKMAGKVTKTSGKTIITLIVQTTYKPATDPAAPSKYGRGTTGSDKQSGNTSLRFHEGSHGSSAMDYVEVNALPVFSGKAGDTVSAYDQAVEKFKTAIATYSAKMLAENAKNTDCTGTPDPSCIP